MSDKAHKPKTSSPSSSGQTALDSDIVNRIKSDLSRGLGSPTADQTRSPRKTALLKTLHAGWRALGRPLKRGTLPPPLDVAKKHLMSANKLIEAFTSGELDLERFVNGIIDDHEIDVLERLGVTTRAAMRQ